MIHSTTALVPPSLTRLIQDLDHEARWVAWQTQPDRDSGKPRKMPYDPHYVLRPAKANDPTTWGTRRQAETCARQLTMPCGQGGVGLQLGVLLDGTCLTGIDLDTCRDATTWEIEGWARDVLKAFDSYSEVSPSGTGVKTFFRIAAEDLGAVQTALGRIYKDEQKTGTTFKRATGADHPPGIEFYIGRHYFTLTDQMLVDSTLELRLVPLAIVLELLTVTGPSFATDGRIIPQMGVVLSKASGTFAPTGNQSRSAKAWRLMLKHHALGESEQQIYAVLQADAETAAWLREKGDANGGREFKRSYARAVAHVDARAANEFDALEPAP
jgi:putative DNA primase/helicase